VWVDRGGREETIGSPAAVFRDVSLSPDGQRLAFATSGGGDDIWTYDLQRGAATRHMLNDEEDETPVWSPDGRWVAYASTRGSRRIVFRRRADASGPEQMVWSAAFPTHAHVTDWSPDGATLLIEVNGGDGRNDIATVPAGGGVLQRVVESAPNEQGGQLSPDGRWLAYTSDESGRPEVYVQPFPDLDAKWQISTGGGHQPRWSQRGDELFYRGVGEVMAVKVSSSSSFSAGRPMRLFADTFTDASAARSSYDVAGDAQRFLMVKEVDDSGADVPRIQLVLGWFDELRRRVPVN
jgi:Tol biopolymer transport system component